MVVNLDGTTNESTGITINFISNSWVFPADSAPNHYGLGVLVEAARGNLESTANANAARVPYAAMGVTPSTGYAYAYAAAVMSCYAGWPASNCVVPLRHPIGDAVIAAQNFFGTLYNDADVHFGLVTFSTSAGSRIDPNDSTHTGAPFYMGNYAGMSANVSTNPYPYEPVQPINPCIYLNPAAGQSNSNYSTQGTIPSGSNTGASPTTVNGALWTVNTNTATAQFDGFHSLNSTSYWGGVTCEGQTNIQDALDTALAMLLGSRSGDSKNTPNGRAAMSLARSHAARAIVLFTDGLPNEGTDSGTTDPATQAEASFAKTNGIPIYTVGLCMVSSLQADQTTVLTDSSGSTGVAALSGNGAMFMQTVASGTSNSVNLNECFQNVARQLCHLVY
jgi:hypothetical protein